MLFGLRQFLLVTTTLVLLSSAASAAPRIARFAKRVPAANNVKRSMTNAERLARGLSPNPPRLASPTRVRRSGPSGVPQPPVLTASCPKTGYIKASTSDGFQYFDNAPAGATAPIGNTSDTAHAGIFNFDPCLSQPFAIACTNCANKDFQFLDAVVAPYGGDNFGPYSQAYGYFAPGSTTPVGGPPQYIPSAPSPDGNEPSEASIWNYDDTTLAFNATWVNQDGSPAQLYTSLLQGSSYFSISGHPNNVTLTFVPI